MVAGGRWWTHPLLRSALEWLRAGRVPTSDRLALAPSALAPQPERPRPLGQNETLDRPLAASRTRISSLSTAPHGRHYLRKEPDAGNPLVRSRGGGQKQS